MCPRNKQKKRETRDSAHREMMDVVGRRGEKQSWKESVHPAGPRGRASSGGSIITLTSTACRGKTARGDGDSQETGGCSSTQTHTITDKHTHTHTHSETPSAPGTYLLPGNLRCENDLIYAHVSPLRCTSDITRINRFWRFSPPIVTKS